MLHTALPQSFLALDLHNCRFILSGRDKFIADNYNRVIFDAALDDEVGNSSSVGKCRDVTSNLVESQLEESPKTRWSWAFDLSPIMTMEASEATVESFAEAETKGESSALANARRVAFETEEWIPPQRPLSNEIMTKSSLGWACRKEREQRPLFTLSRNT